MNPRAQHPDPDPRVYELRSHQAEEADREATPQWWEREEHFTPPEPPPAPLPRGPRGLAWAGVFGLPVIAIVCVLVRYAVPEWVGTLALLAFLASMGYLFWTMPRNDDDDDPFGGNNGAVV